jgi:hypothetical protein
MGLFDFLKPKKNPTEVLLETPAVRNAMVGMDLDYLQKHAANLVSVGRTDEAKTAVKAFLQEYSKGTGATLSRVELARLSYNLTYKVLPKLVHSRWSEFMDLWNGSIPFPYYFAIKGASDQLKRLSSEQLQEFKYYQGDLKADLKYYLIEFPAPPPQTGEPTLEKVAVQLAQGKKLSPESVPVLGPYFAVACHNAQTSEVHFYILGQSPSGGTTLRIALEGGAHANCGPGPEPAPNTFLQAVADRL